MSEVRIAAEPRTEFGKGAARRTRRAHKVPAVIYGHGTAPRHIALPGHELMLALKTPNILLAVEINGQTELTLPKSVQRDPVKGSLEHVDLVLVTRGEKVTVQIPVRIVGETVAGGLLTQELTVLEVKAEAARIPAEFEIVVAGLRTGTVVRAGDVTLPAGVDLVTDPECSVLHVVAARTAEQVEAELLGVPLTGAQVAAGVEQKAPPGQSAREPAQSAAASIS